MSFEAYNNTANSTTDDGAAFKHIVEIPNIAPEELAPTPDEKANCEHPDELDLRRRMYEHALVLAPRVRPDLTPEQFGEWVLSMADKNQKRRAA